MSDFKFIERRIEELDKTEWNSVLAKTRSALEEATQAYMQAEVERAHAVTNLHQYERSLLEAKKENIGEAGNDELAEKLRAVREQSRICEELEGKFQSLLHESEEYYQKIRAIVWDEKKEAMKKIGMQVLSDVTNHFKILTNGFQEGKDLYQDKNTQYSTGNKDAILTTGTEAKALYGSVLEKLQTHAVNFGRNIGRSIQSFVEEKKAEAKKKADEIKRNLSINTEKNIETKTNKFAGNLAAKMEQARSMQQEMARKTDGNDILGNALYNAVLDRAKQLTTQVISYGERELNRRAEMEREGIPTERAKNEELLKIVTDARKTMSELKREAPATYRMQSDLPMIRG